jgi:thiosulfate/3-mercaptopyruvate sulfurtransferase
MTPLRQAAAVFCATLLRAVPPCDAQAPADILVSTEWLASHAGDRGLIVLHTAGSRADYDAGHVPGARWLPWQAYTAQRDGLSTELPDPARLDSALESLGVTDASRIVITGGPIQTTARLYFTLDYVGLGARVSLLDGGIDAWREEGRKLEVASPVAEPGSLTLRPQFDKLVDARWIAASTASGARVAVLDARVPEFFAGLASNNNPRAGRLPTAANVPFSWTTGELTRFRDRPKLERLFAAAGVRQGDKVVTYCHVGMQASVVYLVARLLGHEAAVYDGSFEDWSRRTEMPVAGPSAPRPPDR